MLHLTEWTESGDAVGWSWRVATLGSVSKSGAGYSVALKGLGDLLAQAAAPTTSPTCRASLGDRDLRGGLATADVDCAIGRGGGRTRALRRAGRRTLYIGSLRWLTGPCAGIRQMIVDQSGAGPFSRRAAALCGRTGHARGIDPGLRQAACDLLGALCQLRPIFAASPSCRGWTCSRAIRGHEPMIAGKPREGEKTDIIPAEAGIRVCNVAAGSPHSRG